MGKRLAICVPLAAAAACSGPQSTLAPAGPAARSAAWLWWGMFVASALLLVVVVALWLYAIWRRQPRAADDRVGRRWIVGGGLVLPLVSIALLLVFGIPAGHRMLPLPLVEGRPYEIRIVGHQWWWEVLYPDAGVTTANELVMPAGVPIDFHVTSDDVIHSFWVPRLGGKMDMVPGRVNVHRLQADSPGSWRGQCSEFCGHYHAHMVLPVKALPMHEFRQWLERRRQPVVVESEWETAVAAFQEECGGCHRVRGISEGTGGPDLTNVGSRPLLGGRPRAPEAPVHYWLTNHRRASGSATIPDHSRMAPGQLREIATWLETLGHD